MLLERRHVLSMLGMGGLLTIAPRASASRAEPLSLEQMMTRSAAVVAATVTSVDDRAGDKASEPLTRVTLDVSDVLHGRTSGKAKEQLIFRGGQFPNGETVSYSNVIELLPGERYILFVRSEYYISPLLPGSGSVLRIATVGGRSVVVNQAGHGLLVSPRHGLLAVGAVAAGLEARNERLKSEPSLVAQPEPIQSLANLELCSPVAGVFAELRARSQKVQTSLGSFPTGPKAWPAQFLRDQQKMALERRSLPTKEPTP